MKTGSSLLLLLTFLTACSGGGGSKNGPDPAKDPNTLVDACEQIKSGENLTRVRYKTREVPYDATCEQETQKATCAAGTLSWDGSFTEVECSPVLAKACGDTPHGGKAKRTRYKSARVPFGNVCEKEEQEANCVNGELSAYSGTFTFDSCKVEEPLSCGSTPHGAFAEQERYQKAELPYGADCDGENKEIQKAFCTNGKLSAFSGSFQAESCKNLPPAACGNIPHNDFAKVKYFEAAQVPFGTECKFEESKALCNNGTLGPYSKVSYTFTSCAPAKPKDCGNIPHNTKAKKTFFQKSEVPYNETCVSEEQEALCYDGVLGDYKGSKSFKNTSCKVLDKPECQQNETFSRQRYESAQVDWPKTCTGKEQKGFCKAGKVVWEDVPGYPETSCVSNGPRDCELAEHGKEAEIVRYTSETVPFGTSCTTVAETRKALCTDGKLGEWSGKANFDSCKPELPKDCSEEGLKHGETKKKALYKSATVAWNAECATQDITGACDNGRMKWPEHNLSNYCEKETPLACGSLAHDDTMEKTYFKTKSVAWNASCESETRGLKCQNGKLIFTSGSFKEETCTPNTPRACEGGVAHGDYLKKVYYREFQVEWNRSCSDVAVDRKALCTDGTLGELDGPFSFPNCFVKSPRDCTADNLKHGETKTVSGYTSTTVPWKQSCQDVATVRIDTCENGRVIQPENAPQMFDTCEPQKPVGCGSLAHGESIERYRFKKSKVSDQKSCEDPDNVMTQTSTCSNGTMQPWSETPGFASETCSQALDDTALTQVEGYTGIYRGGGGGGSFHLCTLDKAGRVACQLWSDKDSEMDVLPKLNGKVRLIKELNVPDQKSFLQELAQDSDVSGVYDHNRMMCALQEDGTVSCWAYSYKTLQGPIHIKRQRPQAKVVDFAFNNHGFCLAYADSPAECFGTPNVSKNFNGRVIREFQSTRVSGAICGLDTNKVLTCADDTDSTEKTEVDAFAQTEFGICSGSGKILTCQFSGKSVEMPRVASKLKKLGYDLIAIDQEGKAFGAYPSTDPSENSSVFGSRSLNHKPDPLFVDATVNDATDVGVGEKKCMIRTDGKLRCEWIIGREDGKRDPNFAPLSGVYYRQAFRAREDYHVCALAESGLVDCFTTFPSPGHFETNVQLLLGNYLSQFLNPLDLWYPDSSFSNFACAIRQDRSVACSNDDKEFVVYIPGKASSFLRNTYNNEPCKYGEIPIRNGLREVYCMAKTGKTYKAWSPGQDWKAKDCTLSASGKITCKNPILAFSKDSSFKSLMYYRNYCAMEGWRNNLSCHATREDGIHFNAVQTNGEHLDGGWYVCYLTPTLDVECIENYSKKRVFPDLKGADRLILDSVNLDICVLKSGRILCQPYSRGKDRT